MKKTLILLSILFFFGCTKEQVLIPTPENQQADSRALPTVKFKVQNVAFLPGQTVEAKFTVRNFTDLTAFQFAMQYDTSKLLFSHTVATDAIPPTLYLSVEWEDYGLAPGEVRVAWVHDAAGGVTLPDNAQVFSFFFTAKKKGKLAGCFPFWPDNYVFPPEASDGAFNILPLTVTYIPIPPTLPTINADAQKK